MKPRGQLVLFALTFSACCQPLMAQQMFRGDAQHTGYISTAKEQVFDYQSWRFDAGSPVRSTPLATAGSVYFGTAEGTFFCLETATGREKWRFATGYAINSSPAYHKGTLYFSNNRQTLYALNAASGQKLWQFNFGQKLDYPWRFDYYYSSPLLTGNKIYIGGDDGMLYCINVVDGKPTWKFKASGIIRSTPALHRNSIVFGDTEGILYSVDASTGKENWRFTIDGHTLKNEAFGYDRRAIISSPAVKEEKVVIGGRDGFLYCVSALNGSLVWKVDHKISWVNTSAAVKDSLVVTGTSDGRFVQAVNLYTGQEVWKTSTGNLVWSSPVIYNHHVYTGTFDGQLLILDVQNGKRVSQFHTTDKLLSSPVIADNHLYIGCDNGYFYALGGRPYPQKVQAERYVYYDPEIKIYFRSGADAKIKSYLESHGFKLVTAKELPGLLTSNSTTPKTIVLATNYFPKEVRTSGSASQLTRFLNNGHRIILLGNNPAFYDVEEATQNITTNFLRADTLLGINYAFNDTRGHGGLFPAMVTPKGKQFGLPPSWVSGFSLNPSDVSTVLGKNENGAASAWIKNYSNGGALIQLWIHPETPSYLDCIIKLSEEII